MLIYSNRSFIANYQDEQPRPASFSDITRVLVFITLQTFKRTKETTLQRHITLVAWKPLCNAFDQHSNHQNVAVFSPSRAVSHDKPQSAESSHIKREEMPGEFHRRTCKLPLCIACATPKWRITNSPTDAATRHKHTEPWSLSNQWQITRAYNDTSFFNKVLSGQLTYAQGGFCHSTAAFDRR